jgi:hypothetical protein
MQLGHQHPPRTTRRRRRWQKPCNPIKPQDAKYFMPGCTNRSCGQNPIDWTSKCQFHPGLPLFHEGLKSWTCCNKKMANFQDFLNLPGCTFGEHSTAVQKTDLASARPKQTESTTIVEQKTPVPIETASTGQFKLKYISSASKKEEPTPEQDLFDPPDANVALNTLCKRKGCGAAKLAQETTCNYHPGNPVFHEGSKGWSCCPRRVLEFDEFLRIAGCTSGKHRFTQVEPSKTNPSVSCKYDWYQTSTSVIFSVFAKNVNDTVVEFGTNELRVHLAFKDSLFFEMKVELPVNLFNPDYFTRKIAL